MSGLKIALINTFYPPYNFGGDGVYVRRLAHVLARRGCDVHILHDTETFKALTAKPLGSLEPLPEPPGVTVHRLESAIGPLATLITHQTGRPLVHHKALHKFFQNQFDVTHFHNVSAVGGPGMLSMGSGVRLYTAHEHWLVCPTHILWRHNRELCHRRECFKCQLAYRRPPQLWRHTDFLETQAGNIDAFIALSQSSAENHAKFGFPFKMIVMPSFLPDDEITLSAGPDPCAKNYVLFVGRLEKLKGLQDIIPEFRGRPRIDLKIIGDGDYRSTLERLAAGASNIQFLGRLPSTEIGQYYANATAVILPSVCYEVFPLVALEAFRAGVPIVARNLGPFPEIIKRSGAGFLFDEPQEAVSAAERLASDGELRVVLADAARRAFIHNWSEGVALARYFNLIAEKAKKRGLRATAEKALSLASKRVDSR